MKIYINGIGSVSPQQLNARNGGWILSETDAQALYCNEPDYKDIIPPMQLRRMSKVVRIGIAAAKQALHDAHTTTPEMIMIGTAYGCLADTEVFLKKLVEQDEQMLTPTSFIQSTHNTVGGQVALFTQCYGANLTFVHRGLSFESALQESILCLNEKEADTLSILTGGIDELTDTSKTILSRFHLADQQNKSLSDEMQAGEGAHFFVLSKQKSAISYARVIDMYVFNNSDLKTELKQFLQRNDVLLEQIDIVLAGFSGQATSDELEAFAEFLPDKLLRFKKYCGHFPTSTSFALSLACTMLYHDELPLQLNQFNKAGTLQHGYILIYNQYKQQHSFILLGKA